MKQRHVDPLDSAGELVIDAAEDTRWVGDQGVAGGGAQVDRGKAGDDVVRDAVGGRQGQVERGRVGDAGPVDVRRREPGGRGEPLDLQACPVDQHHADPQAAQDADVEQQVGEILVGNDCPVESDHEHFVAKRRDVAQDFPQIGEPLHSKRPVTLGARVGTAAAVPCLRRHYISKAPRPGWAARPHS